MPVYSHSRLETFENCPRKYFYQYVAKIKVKRVDTIEAFLGSQVHSALEKLYKDRMRGRLLSEEELVTIFNTAWHRGLAKGVKVVRPEYTEEDFRCVGEECLRKYHRRHTPFDDSNILALENRVTVDLDGTGRYKLQGYIDRLTQRPDSVYEIHDYKTNAALPSQADKDQDRQLALYQIGIANRWADVDQVELVWHFLRFDKQIRSTRSPEQLVQLKTDTIDLIDDIESREGENAFPTNESRLCDWCDFQSVCPARKHLVRIQDLNETQLQDVSGVQLVDRCSELTSQIKQLKEQIASLESDKQQAEDALTSLAAAEDLELIAGTTHEVTVSRRTDISLPSKSSDSERYRALEASLRNSSGWVDVSALDRHALRRIWKGEQEDPAGIRAQLEPYVDEVESTVVKLRPRVSSPEDS